MEHKKGGGERRGEAYSGEESFVSLMSDSITTAK